MMISFCKSKVHSFLGLPNCKENGSRDEYSFRCCRNILSPGGGDGLSLITVARESHRQSNVVESSVVKSPASSPPAAKRDPGGVGFLDEVGGGVDGLTSCTESLGFESSDERRLDNLTEEMNEDNGGGLCSRTTAMRRPKSRRSNVKKEARKFPPPLSSLNPNGQPSFILRPVRKDGRLELSEVWINRPKILCASREDGRLRLHLIRDEDIEEKEEEEQEQEQEEDGEEEIEESEEKEEERVSAWMYPVAAASGGEELRRCHELVDHHHRHHRHHHNHSNHPHHLHVWRQHCVTTR